MLKTVGTLTMANGVNALFAFGVAVVAARTLSAGEFGVLSVLATTGVFLALSLDFGMNQILTGRVAVRNGSRLTGDVLGLRVVGALLVTLVLGLVLLATKVGVAPSLATGLGSWMLLAVSTAWQVVFSTEHAVLQGQQRYGSLAALIVTVNAMRLLFVAGLGYLGATFEGVLAAYFLPSIIAGVLTALMRRSLLRWTAPRRLVRVLLPVIALAGVTVSLSSMLFRVGIWAVSALDGSEAAGTYAVALQAASLVLTFGSAIALSFLPQIARLDKERAMHGFFVSYVRRSIPVFGALLVGAAVFSLFVPRVFGSRYEGTRTITFLLMGSYIVSTFNSPFYLLQQSRRRYAFLVKVHLVQVVVLVVGCVLLIPGMGPTGAAIAELAMRVATVAFFVARGMAEARRELVDAAPVGR